MSYSLVYRKIIYDLVFADMAYNITNTANSVTITYAIGYASEILITILFAGFIDQFNKWKLLIYTQIANIWHYLKGVIDKFIYLHSI